MSSHVRMNGQQAGSSRKDQEGAVSPSFPPLVIASCLSPWPTLPCCYYFCWYHSIVNITYSYGHREDLDAASHSYPDEGESPES